MIRAALGIRLIAAVVLLGLFTVVPASAQGPVTIESITADCSGGGVLTVSSPVAGATVTLVVTYHVPGGGSTWTSTEQTATITLVDGQTDYPYTIDVVTGVPAEANSIRVEVLGTSGATFNGTTTKSESFGPCGQSSPSPTATTPAEPTATTPAGQPTATTPAQPTATTPGQKPTQIPATKAPVQPTATTAAVALPNTGAGDGSDGDGVFPAMLIGGAALLASVGVLLARQQRATRR